MAGALVEPASHRCLVHDEVDEPDMAQAAAQGIAMPGRQRRARHDQRFTPIEGGGDNSMQSGQPRIAVGLIERNPPGHLREVRRGMVVVGVLERPSSWLDRACPTAVLPDPATPMGMTTTLPGRITKCRATRRTQTRWRRWSTTSCAALQPPTCGVSGRAETLQPTAPRPRGLHAHWPTSAPWTDKRHFVGIAARSMRQILVERARARGAQKTLGRPQLRVSLSDSLAVAADPESMLPALDEALERRRDHRCRAGADRRIALTLCAGLSIEETADVIGISPATMKRRWSLARAWLFRELAGEAR